MSGIYWVLQTRLQIEVVTIVYILHAMERLLLQNVYDVQRALVSSAVAPLTTEVFLIRGGIGTVLNG